MAKSRLADHPVMGQQNPNATATSAANAAGTTVNNQSNSQINTNTFYGFGPGINCPAPSLCVAGFSGMDPEATRGIRWGLGIRRGLL